MTVDGYGEADVVLDESFEKLWFLLDTISHFPIDLCVRACACVTVFIFIELIGVHRVRDLLRDQRGMLFIIRELKWPASVHLIRVLT